MIFMQIILKNSLLFKFNFKKEKKIFSRQKKRNLIIIFEKLKRKSVNA